MVSDGERELALDLRPRGSTVLRTIKVGLARIEKRPGHRISLLGLTALGLALGGCFEMRINQDPLYKSFFEKAQLIMTPEEIKIYRSLPDENTKAEFIEEFWEIRDPDPGTEENEAKTEFAERVRFANLWFGTFNPHRGWDTGEDREDRRGWSEDRGRIYIILGPPDVIWYFNGQDEYPRFDGTRDRARANEWTAEQWIYERYQVYVVFARASTGSWNMQTRDARLFEVLDWAKLNWISTEFKEDIRRRFRFKARFEPGGIQVSVPVSRVNFDQNFRAEFAVRINVYLDNTKVDEVQVTKPVQEDEESLTAGKKKTLEFIIPYSPPGRGKYLFDIVIQDKMAPSLSKYRSFVKLRF
jgi:GWxTD domain-containing protein